MKRPEFRSCDMWPIVDGPAWQMLEHDVAEALSPIFREHIVAPAALRRVIQILNLFGFGFKVEKLSLASNLTTSS